jgi:hypothetical protein
MGKSRARKREVKKVLKQVRAKKHKVKPTKASHFCIVTPGGPVFCSSTPSDVRAMKNLVAMLKRKGVKL